MAMTSSKPYLLRALYEWIVDNNCTPHLLVNAHLPGVQVPQQHVDKNGHIVLNISPSAIQHFSMDNDAISFSARFGGIVNNLYVPTDAVQGIYTRENGQGMMFEPEEIPEPPTPAPSSTEETKSPAKRPGLRVVK